LSSFFGGKVSALTAQLLESEQLSAEEIEALRNMIDEKGGST
jgi:predicted transcriptional regulator